MAAPGHERRIRANAPAAGRPQTADPAGGQGGFRLGPLPDARTAQYAARPKRKRRNGANTHAQLAAPQYRGPEMEQAGHRLTTQQSPSLFDPFSYTLH
jgi:hypothetical protein